MNNRRYKYYTGYKSLRDYTGFTLTETLIYILIFSILVVIIICFALWFGRSNNKTKAMREVLSHGRRVMTMMISEIKEAKSIYTPTTSSTQLSLETMRYLPVGESISYIEFYLCDTSRICLKKESQDAIFLTPENIEITSLSFTQIENQGFPSIKIDLTCEYKNPDNRPEYDAFVDLTSTASLRSY